MAVARQKLEAVPKSPLEIAMRQLRAKRRMENAIRDLSRLLTGDIDVLRGIGITLPMWSDWALKALRAEITDQQQVRGREAAYV